MKPLLILLASIAASSLFWAAVYLVPKAVCLVMRHHVKVPWRHPTRGIIERCERCGAITPLLRAVK